MAGRQLPEPESVANACNASLQARATPCRCGFLIGKRQPTTAGGSKETACAHHLGGRGSPVLDQDYGGTLCAFAGSGTMPALASCDTAPRGLTAAAPEPSPFVAWWTRNFRGGADQVLEVRHWLEDLLPDCAARTDVLLLASELCTNAVVHSRSGEPGGQFSVDVDWAPTLARVVVGDQGSAKAPAMAARTGDAAQLGESGRGLLLVDDVADDWGTASRPNRRWVWADVDWQARGGPPLGAPGGLDAVIASNAMIRKAFPGTSIWWGHLTTAWWSSVPESTNTHGLIRAPTHDSLIQSLARAYPRAARPRVPAAS
jgi:serine/threonine-protein kinase RsbW